MNKFLLTVGIMLTSFSTYANSNCFGSDTMYTCNDYKTGNTYNVSKFGGSTQVQARNSRTGSTWSQNTQTYGNQSHTTGRDQNGNTWRHNTNQVGNTQYYNGSDSNGNYYNGSCGALGCVTNRMNNQYLSK